MKNLARDMLQAACARAVTNGAPVFVERTQTYDEWVEREAGRTVEQMRADAMAGIMGKSLYFIRSTETEYAKTVLAFDPPAGTYEVIRWNCGTTDRVSSVPYLHIGPQLLEYCRRLPVFPTH